MPRLVKEEVVQKMDAFHLFPYHLGPSINVLHKRTTHCMCFCFHIFRLVYNEICLILRISVKF